MTDCKRHCVDTSHVTCQLDSYTILGLLKFSQILVRQLIYITDTDN